MIVRIEAGVYPGTDEVRDAAFGLMLARLWVAIELRHPEVNELDPPCMVEVEQEISGLDVAVGETERVDVLKSVDLRGGEVGRRV